jgi:multiple sugar transport system substrate-binding protein
MGTLGKAVQGPALWGGNVLTNPQLSKFADVIETDLVPADEREPTRRVTCMGGYGLSIAYPGKNVDEAYKFIKFVTLKENQRLYVANTGQPGRSSALTDPENIKVAKYFKGLSKNLPLAMVRPAIPEYSEIEDIIGVEIDKAITGEQTPRQAMDNANKKIYDLFVKTGRIK